MIQLVLIVSLTILSAVSVAAVPAEMPGRHLESLVLENLELNGQVNPKVYAVDEDRQVGSHGESLCFTNPDVIAAAAQLAATHFRDNPESEEFYLWVDQAECRCDNCRKLDSDSSHSGSYLHLVLKTAAKVSTEYPRKKIGYVAVGKVVGPPVGLSLPDNVIVLIPLKSGCIDKSSLDLVAQWNLCASDITAYIDYHWNRTLSEYMPRQVLEELAALREAGISSCIMDIPQNAVSEPLIYLAAELQADPSVKPEQVLDEYFDSTYDAWAPAVKEFYATLQTATIRRPLGSTDYNPDRTTIEKAWLLLKTAKQTAYGPPRDRIEELQKEFILTYLPAKASRLASTAGSRTVRNMADLAASIADLQSALETAGAVERVYANHPNADGPNELQAWEEKMIPLLRSGAERIQQWTVVNLAEEEAETALTELTYRLLENPWADKARLAEIF